MHPMSPVRLDDSLAPERYELPAPCGHCRRDRCDACGTCECCAPLHLRSA